MDGAIRSGERVAQEIAALVLGITSLEEAPEIKVFPNPFTEYLEVQITRGDWALKVYTLDGRLVKETVIRSSGSARINMVDLPIGTYILTFENGQKVISSKIVKGNK